MVKGSSWAAEATAMSPTVLQGEDTAPIFDIRRDSQGIDLEDEICRGLATPTPSLPSLLLWDDQGQTLFDDLSQEPWYYPFHGEVDALTQHGGDIGRSVPEGSYLVELGCGAIRKTKSILAHFHQQQKAVHYVALDVSQRGLSSSLAQLRRLFKDSPFITVTGLLGTYEDCVAWLADIKSQSGPNSVAIMWLGNSIANLGGQVQASGFLARFREACERSGLGCQFVVSTDICQRDDKVLDAYSLDRPKLRAFLLNSLKAANAGLGRDNALRLEDWRLVRCLERVEHAVCFYLEAVRDVRVELPPPGPSSSDGAGRPDCVLVARGERVRLISSGKWEEASVDEVCKRAGFCIQQRWKDANGDYCIFFLGTERRGRRSRQNCGGQ